MWVPWVKSPGRVHSRAHGSTHFDLQTPPRSPIHKHSISFKEVETLFNDPDPFIPQSPIHYKDDPFFKPIVSLKDIHALLKDEPTRPISPLGLKSSIFHRVRAWASAHQKPPPPPDALNRVVIYYTSLRVVRRTFEDCRAVRSIIKGYRVKIDERDLSMDGAFVDELQGIIKEKKRDLKLPRVFVNGKYVGGAEEIRRLHESGDLRRLIQGLPLAEVGVCCVCGGYRFVVCERCDGSHRMYVDNKNGFRGCSRCNENGLIRCLSCTSVVF